LKNSEFLHRVVAELKVPNAETRAAMEESRAMMAARKGHFTSAQALFDDLEQDTGLPRVTDDTKRFRKD
jgi:hypothetical protein